MPSNPIKLELHRSTQLPVLQVGDRVEIIAPASRFSDGHLSALRALLQSWGLDCVIQEDLFGKDLLCAQTDEKRFTHLHMALSNPETKAVICGRGGYGSMRLIPALQKMDPPMNCKLFIGMSDITALHLFLQQSWRWPTIHAGANPDKLSPESIQALYKLLFGQTCTMSNLVPLNCRAEENTSIQGTITGGNLSLIQAGIGTDWQLNGEQKIIVLEEIGERAYRIDRMLEHLKQAQIFRNSNAIILGDFLEGNEPNGSSLIEPVLQRFADQVEIPVFQMNGVGHGYENFPLILGTSAKISMFNNE